jgi:hypothetical protein
VKLSDALGGLGRPVAYYPELARFFGSVDAAILFAQLFYWRDRASHDYQYHTGAKIEAETGLSIREQRKARTLLVNAGVLYVKRAPLQHETHYKIIEDSLDDAWSDWARAGKPDNLKLSRGKRSLERDASGRFRGKHVRSAASPTSAVRRSGEPRHDTPEGRTTDVHPIDFPKTTPGDVTPEKGYEEKAISS